MVFPTIEFAAFFLVVMALSWWLMPRPRYWKPFMLAASYFFYGYTDTRFVLLLVASTLVNQAAATLLARRRDRRILIGAIAADLGLLAWFKYYGFFALSVDRTLDQIGLGAPLPLLQVALPIGISFFTFQALSYVIDVWRGDTRPAKLIDFAVYEAFFPHLVAGPIVRAREFIPQLASPRDRAAVPATRAVFLICGGLVKKVVLADLLARRLVDPVFDTPGQHSSIEVLVAIYGYAVQIYCDFSAYSDIAIGIALLLGFRFPDNFDRPYAATSLREFWRRWHLTLSRWLRDYVYVPLGGSRRGPRRTQLNLLITMVLGGLWHGAAWTFVCWGAAHGAGLAAERAFVRRRARPHGHRRPVDALMPLAADHAARSGTIPHPRAGGDPARLDPAGSPALTPALTAVAQAPAPVAARLVTVAPGTAAPGTEAPETAGTAAGRWVRRIVTFHLVCAAWVLFRSPDLTTTGEILRRLVTGGLAVGLVTPTVILAIVVGLGLAAVPARWWAAAQGAFDQLRLPVQALAVAAFLLVMYSFVGQQDVAPFIYFRF
ncbi:MULTISPECIES: MBOAT family O-acyltransferase [Pseudofrankia]|uniref:MBOAT family O-acyltransferase n=1 Tax=Pseudofrankia TaxID=2994363 RepID=UPI000234B9BC|nr:MULTISPECIES: MBOAT family O-acyltransferase [Pseudofrankia]OHV37908.1 acyltransferase [Pseudofrankia sp. EUN1h]